MNKIYGIIGHPVSHSLSPILFQAAFEAENIDAEYQVFDIDPGDPENLANFCYETDLNGIAGFSVTAPYKQTIMTYMDFYDPLAKIVKAVNTVVNEDGKLIGCNTDATGGIQALNEKIKPKNKRVLLLGAGGAARAIAYSLKEYGADVLLWNRTMEKAEALAREFDLETIEYRSIKPETRLDIIINATLVGCEPAAAESLLHADQIKKGSVVMDMVTCPLKTQLLKEAEKAGAETITGARMLLHQAADQFAIWFGKKAPLKAMEKALYNALKKR